VELALLLPVLLLLTIGVLDLGRGVYAYITLANAAREGARQAIVTSASEDFIRTTVVQAAVGLPISSSDVTISGSRTPGSAVTVSVTYRFVPVTPVIRQMVGDGVTIRGVSTMVVE
jgi:Flp pilus assembly protein TadG